MGEWSLLTVDLTYPARGMLRKALARDAQFDDQSYYKRSSEVADKVHYLTLRAGLYRALAY